MTTPEHAAAASHPARSAPGDAEVGRTPAVLSAAYQELVRELAGLPQEEFDRAVEWTHATVNVAVRVVR